jgi:hypothetical protein
MSAVRRLRFAAVAMLTAIVMPVAGVQSVAAQGASPWYGKSVSATVDYQNRIRRGGQEFNAPLRLSINLTISADGKVTGDTSRSSTGPRGPLSSGRRINTQIGKPGEVRGSGHGVVVASGSSLTILRTWEVGGAKITINMQGGGRCSISAPVMREVGAGTTKRDHIASGTVEILSSRQVGSSCTVR